MSHPQMSDRALDAIDQFIVAGEQIAQSPLLLDPKMQSTADQLCEITLRIFTSNGYMTKWLNDFLYLDVGATDFPDKYRALAKDYDTKKNTPEFSKMKWDCGDIRTIYEQKVEPEIGKLFDGDPQGAAKARSAFEGLGTADGAMIAFIYETLGTLIDDFKNDMNGYVAKNQRNAAERRRLKLWSDSRSIVVRLTRFSGQLSDLAQQFGQRAGRTDLSPSPDT